MSFLHIHNTLSRQKEPFSPLEPDNVRMYVCGPTVYDFAHLGNARPVVVFDTLYRLLKRHFPKVTYVRNITDIDDKIMARAAETGEDIATLTTRTTAAFHADMDALNALRPDIEPRATQYVSHMIALCQTLLDKGHAYEAEGHVLFNVPSMPEYGQLSRRSRDELVAGARVEVAPYKKDPADFVLWKPSHAEQQGWESPWGRGRPGWHIECSAMAKDNLGETFDIHGGGLDLIFPHHENEIAQSRCAHHGAPLAKYWMHNGFLTINSDKMSKSLNNFYTVRELISETPAEALRLTLLSAHYRQPLDFSVESLRQSKATLDKWYGALRGLKPNQAEAVPAEIETALLDDLNTPQAIAFVHELANELNKNRQGPEAAALAGKLRAAGQALGLLFQSAEDWFKWQSKEETLSSMSDTEIEQQITARAEAKKAKNFALADTIRKTLLANGIILEDSATGTTWRRK